MEKLGAKVRVKISGLTEQPQRRKLLEKGVCVWTGKEMKSKAFQRRTIITVQSGAASLNLNLGPVKGKFSLKDLEETELEEEKEGGKVAEEQEESGRRKRKAKEGSKGGRPQKRARKGGGVKTRKDKKVEKGNRCITKWFGGTEKIQDEEFNENVILKGIT